MPNAWDTGTLPPGAGNGVAYLAGQSSVRAFPDWLDGMRAEPLCRQVFKGIGLQMLKW